VDLLHAEARHDAAEEVKAVGDNEVEREELVRSSAALTAAVGGKLLAVRGLEGKKG